MSHFNQKILAKTLASRLIPLATKLIHPYQTGFIPNRHLFHNFRHLFNILYCPRNPKEDLFVLSLDAEKAFDCVELPYLYAVLEKFGLETRFISWIRLLYSDPSARILTYQAILETISRYRGTTQGCPLLFVLALEPLAATISAKKEFHGYDVEYTSNKKLLYADDILMYIMEQQTSIPVLLETTELISSFSGYRVSWGNSELMPVRSSDPGVLEWTPFKLA